MPAPTPKLELMETALYILRTLLFVAVSAPPFLMLLTGCVFTGLGSSEVEEYAPGMEGIFCYIDAGALDECASETEIAMGVDVADIYNTGFWAGRSSKYGLKYSPEADAKCGQGKPFKVHLQGAFPEGNPVCVDANKLFTVGPGKSMPEPLSNLRAKVTNTCKAWCREHKWVDGDGNEYNCDSVSSQPFLPSQTFLPIPNACTESKIFRADFQDLRRMKPKPVVWTAVSGVQVNSNGLTKALLALAWNAGAASSPPALQDSNDGFLEFMATETNTRRRIGLAKGEDDFDAGEKDITFAVELDENGQLSVYESTGQDPTLKSTGVTYATGDRIRIAVQSRVVQYFKNGDLFFTSDVAAEYPLRVSASFFHPGATIRNVYTSF
jgi:hypothetical protein